MRRALFLLLAVNIFLLFVGAVTVFAQAKTDSGAEKSRLAVLWTSGDPEVAHKVCFMYTHAAKRSSWFDEVLLIVWGPSSRLLAADIELQTN